MTSASQTLKRKRERAGLSRADLATIVGCSRESIRRYELGVWAPRPATAVAIANALNVDFDELWTEEVAA